MIGEQVAEYKFIEQRDFASDYLSTVSFQNLPVSNLFLLDINLECGGAPNAFYPALRLNNDSGLNYRLVKYSSGGGGITLSETALQSYFEIGSAMSPGEATHMQVIISAKQRTGHQIIKTTSHTNGSGAGDIHYHSGRWANGDAVTRIDIIQQLFAGGWGAGSSVILYAL